MRFPREIMDSLRKAVQNPVQSPQDIRNWPES